MLLFKFMAWILVEQPLGSIGSTCCSPQAR